MISVGNIAMGGRGKTPLVAHIARLLVEAGERPVILSRGYRRRRPQEGAIVVSDGRHLYADLDRSGDEPLMLARAVPGAAVIVSEVRAIGAALAEQTLDVSVHLLDDGFQHRSLRRDIDIVVVTPDDLDSHRVPFGLLRSPVTSLARADAVMVDNPHPEAAIARVSGLVDAGRTRVFAVTRALGEPVPLEAGWPAAHRRAPMVAMAGIAEPVRFVLALKAAGWSVVEAVGFPDHHPYRTADIARVARAMREAGAAGVLTTEKDSVRLLPLRPLAVPISSMPLEVSVRPEDEFRSWLLGRLLEVRR